MGSVMIKPIMLAVITMLVTAVCLMFLQISAQIAHAIYLRLVPLDIIHQLEMASAMISQTMSNVILMVETAVCLMLKQIIALIAHVI